MRGETGPREGAAKNLDLPSEESEGKTLVQELEEALPGEASNNPGSCLEGPDFDGDICRGLDRQYRAIYCSDIPPGRRFNCSEQTMVFDKCASSWLYRESFCLESCNRCGSNCVDEVPPGYDSCSPELCESELYIGVGGSSAGGGVGGDGEAPAAQGGPWCLKTCRRCSPSPPRGVVELLE